jgi:hypothetical protein
MKIIITESQYNLIKEATGVPENILNEARVLYNIVKDKLKEINSTDKKEYLFENIKIDLTVSDINFKNLNFIVNVDELENYDGTEPIIAAMGVGNEFDFVKEWVLKKYGLDCIDLVGMK